ncbi:MAG: PilC/PilY family type IV pilus protein [Pseudomonadota bacterium]
MKSHVVKTMLALTALVFHLFAFAEDTDLFVGAPAQATDLPNVLIVLDNTANWNNAFTNEIAALKSVLTALPVNADGSAKFRVGFMLFTETGSGNSGNDGGYLRAAVRDMTTANKAKYIALLDSFDKNNDKSNGGKLGNTMADAFRYFSNGVPYTGNNKVKTDYAGNTSGTAASNAIYALAGNALASKAGSPYNGPILPGSCGKNFIIYISNGAAQDNSSDTSAATTVLTASGGKSTPIPLSPSGSQDNVGDEWARFMKKSSLGVVTYTVDVDKVTNGQGPGWTALLKSMAGVSSGKYFDVSSAAGAGAEILRAMQSIFSEIQSVNSVFAAVSLPVSVNTQGTYRNQVYIGMFRPDANALPRWAGNLKQYKLGYIAGELKLQDADDGSAINSSTGFITECARSFWTPSTADTYWGFRPLGGCLAIPDSDASNYPDGNIVDKGAQAYLLRSTTTRTLKTCSSVFASCTTLTDFNSTNVTQAMLGAASTAERDQLIEWARGKDVPDVSGLVDGDENGNGITLTEMRPSAHGDVMHSRPVAINFGTEEVPKVVVIYGGNDGVLRAVNGNRSAPIGSVAAGKELWAFLPPEFYSGIKRIRDNNTQINFPGNPTTSPVPAPKPYAIDGPVTAYKDDTRAWVYSSMRRGGRVLYAFDVNISNPADITLKWKKGCPSLSNDTNCTSGFSGMGQTWSSPKTLTASGYGAGASPILIVGGGYDACEDADPNTCTSASKGKHVYVLDADTGALLKTLDTDRGVVADLFIVPDSSGRAKHAYAVDLGGNVYRVNIGSAAPADWTITKIASFGCSTTSTCTANRKFMFTPDVIEENGIYTLMVGSGDREKPLMLYTSAASVANYFFTFKDKPQDAAWLSNELTNNVCGAAVLCLNSLTPISTAATPSETLLATKKGWYLALLPSEQVVTSAITIFDVVTFSTHRPAVNVPGACTSTLGTASVFNILYKNAASATGSDSRSATISGGGLPPSPTAGMVKLDNGSTVPFCIGCSADSPLEGGVPPSPPTTNQPKARVYWYIQK